MTTNKLPRRALPSQVRLRELFHYDFETGKLLNKPGRGHAPAGEEAGSINGIGYRVAYVDGASYQVHHLIWKLIYGTDPDQDVRHLDNDGLNNRINNLKLADPAAPKPVKKKAVTKPLPSQELLRELFHYNQETGELICKVRTGPRSVVGEPVGGQDARGYWTTGLNGTRYKLHRLIWVWMTGEDPGPDVDHQDGDCSNNAWSNLRKVEHHINGKNAKLAKNNTSGVNGVNFDKRHGKWVVRAGDKMKRVHIGRYDTLEEAIEARQAAEAKLGYSDRHGQDTD